MFKWLRRTPKTSMPEEKNISVFSREDLKALMDLNLVFDFTGWELGPVEYKGYSAPSEDEAGIVVCPVCGRRALKQDGDSISEANFLHKVKITQAEFVSCKKEKPEVEEEKCAAWKDDIGKWIPVQKEPLLHKQIVFEPGKGDCLRTCVACLFRIPLESVPNFAETKSEKKFTAAWWDWVEVRGFKIEYKIGAESINYGYNILMGMGPRGVRHAVITFGDSLFHDPHPSDAGLLPHEDKPGYRWIWYSINGVGIDEV